MAFDHSHPSASASGSRAIRVRSFRMLPALGLLPLALAAPFVVLNGAFPPRRRSWRCGREALKAVSMEVEPKFLPSLESMGRGARCGSDAAEAAVLPCFPLPLQRAALPGSKRTLNVMEPRYQRMYQDLLANGARHVVVPRYVQTERATQLAEFAVVFRLTELRDAPPGVRGARYACQHEVLKPVRITRVLNPEDFAKKHTYLRVECQEIIDKDLHEDLSMEEESLREDLQELAMLGRAMPLRRWEYMSDRLGRCRLVDHGPTFSEGTLNLASARRENFWEFVQLWQGHCDRRAVALRQQFERDMQEVRASGDPKRAQMLQELEEAYEVEVQHHWAQNADSMQLLLQCDGHGPRLELMSQLLRQEVSRLAAVTAISASLGASEAQA